MKAFRVHPLLPLLPVFVGLSLLAVAGPSLAADLPARALDWNQAAPKPQGGGAATDSLRSAPSTPAPSPAGTLQPQAQPAFGAKAGGRRGEASPAGQAAVQAAPQGPSKGLFSLDDRAIVSVGGKNTTAGEAKKRINAELAAKAGPPKTFKVGARKLDLALLGVVTGGAERAKTAPPRTMEYPRPLAGLRNAAVTQVAAASPSSWQAAQIAPSRAAKDSIASTQAGSYSATRCLDKGPPKISEVEGRLKAGAKVTVWGECFGDRPGRIEIIGQFPGGKLVPAFTAWDMTGIELQIPADIRGAGDHVVAVSVVTADGKVTPAAQAKYTAARERIEVPDRLWQPSANFELASTTETLNTDTGVNRKNPAASGQVAKSLRLNPQCALDSMEAVVLSGSVTQIAGWEQGPPNEAQVSIDWVGTCIDTKTTTSYHYVVQMGDDISLSSACRVAFQARAWAYCPAGIAP